MTNQQHPVIPGPELLQEWYDDKTDYKEDMIRAAQWGADQELDACCEWFTSKGYTVPLRAARRPKPPSLKEQAQVELDRLTWLNNLRLRLDALKNSFVTRTTMTDYKATPKQWEQVLSWSEERDVSVSCDAACILELRARVEALEAKNKPGFMELSVTTTTAPVCRPNPPSLKEQAYAALDTYIYGNPDHGDKQNTYNTIRRALEQLDD